MFHETVSKDASDLYTAHRNAVDDLQNIPERTSPIGVASRGLIYSLNLDFAKVFADEKAGELWDLAKIQDSMPGHAEPSTSDIQNFLANVEKSQKDAIHQMLGSVALEMYLTPPQTT